MHNKFKHLGKTVMNTDRLVTAKTMLPFFCKWEQLLLPAIAAGIRIDLKYIQNRYKNNRILYHVRTP